MTAPNGPASYAVDCFLDATGRVLAVNPTTGLPVNLVAGSAALYTINAPSALATNAMSRARRISTADTNLHTVKAGAGRLYSITAANDSASKRYLKIYNKATAPVVATDVPVMTLVLPPGVTIQIDYDAVGSYFSAGIAAAITGAMADADSTAIAANDVSVTYDFL